MTQTLKPEWQTKFVEYPNSACNRFETSINLGFGIVATYYPVEGGFKTDHLRRNAKLYTTESEIRNVLLRKLLARARKDVRVIKAAIEDTFHL